MADILILGGTREAAALAQRLVREGHAVTTSLAGRTKEPAPLAGKTRVGGFGGAEGLAAYLVEHAVDRLIDATHPFAIQISANAAEAARLANVTLEHHERQPWSRREDDRWIEVGTLPDAVAAIPTGARVLLALGAQHIAPFADRTDAHFVIRMVDTPPEPLPFAHHTLLTGRPPMQAHAEIAMLRTHAIDHIVCRNSGGAGAYAKIEAARKLELSVIMIRRPSNPRG